MHSTALMDLVDSAESAFASDPAYLIAMAEQSALITYKRALWAVRKEAREAEREARAECAAAPSVACANRSACGFGDCRFAKADHALVHTPARRDGEEREMPGSPYRLEDSISALIELRGIAR